MSLVQHGTRGSGALLLGLVVGATGLACSGDGGQVGQTSRVTVTAEPPGLNCPQGGQRIDTGVDLDDDGVLEPSEVETTAYVCASGPSHRELVSVVAELPGENCSSGGQRIDTGSDLDDDGVLDPEEVTSTSFVCNGTPGGSGHDVLVSVTPVTPGTDCSSGGQRIDTGSDLDDDGVLDPEEVTATSFVCDGSAGGTGHDSLVLVSDEPPGADCPAGGKRIASGVDRDDDGTLDASEIDTTSFVCHGSPGSAGHASLVGVSDLAPGDDCEFGGKRVDSGIDLDDDGTLDASEVGTSSFVCHGSPGSAGQTTLVAVSQVLPGQDCPNGGERVETGPDLNGNGTLDATEVTSTAYVCSGATVLNGGCTVLHGNYTVNNDLDLLAFANAGCTVIDGNLTISNTTLTSLTGLDRLVEIGGRLSISSNPLLTSLSGLEQLERIGGNFTFSDNDAFVHVEGLPALTRIGGGFSITYNASLMDLAGLETLSEVGGAISISSNPGLTCLVGLEGLVQSGGLTISSNAALASIAGLESLTTVTGYLALAENAALADLEGLAALQTVGGALTLRNVDALLDLEGLQALEVVEGLITITGNEGLTSLAGLDNLIAAGGLSIENNPSLTRLAGLESLALVSGSVSLYANASLVEIDGLAALTSIGGSCQITINPGLTSLGGLSALTSVGGSLGIYGNASLTSLAGLEALASIGGSFGLPGSNHADLTSLAGLEGLLHVGGDVTCGNCTEITSLAGLEHLTTIGGSLNFWGAFTSPIRLPALVSVGGSVILTDGASNGMIVDLPVLETVSGELRVGATYHSPGMPSFVIDLGALAWVGTDLRISGNLDPDVMVGSGALGVGRDFGLGVYYGTAIPDLSGVRQVQRDLWLGIASSTSGVADLASLETIGRDFNVSGAGLTSLDADLLRSIGGELSVSGSYLARISLASLSSVSGDLTLTSLPRLTELAPLTELDSVGGDLVLQTVAKLESVDAFASLTVIGGSLVISGNALLGTLTGLHGVTGLGDDLTILSNAALPDCQATWLRDEIGIANIPGTITISGNTGTASCP